MSERNTTLRIPPRVLEGVMNGIGVSVVTRTDGWRTDTYRDTAGNLIDDNAYTWLDGPDRAICSNGAQPNDAQIQEALRRTRAGERHGSGVNTEYHFASETSPLEHMCAVAARPARQR